MYLRGVVAFVIASACIAAQDDPAERGNRVLDEAIRLHEEGRRSDAYDRYREAIPLLEKADDRESLLFSSLNAAALAASLGQYGASLDLANRGLDLSRALGDLDNQARSHNNVALAYQYLGRYSEAIHHYEESLRLNDDRGNQESATKNLNNIGVVLFKLGRFGAAMKSYREAMEIARKHPGEIWSSVQRRIAVLNLAAVLEKIGEIDAAYRLYREVMEEPGLSPEEEAQCRLSLGRVYLTLMDPQRALDCFERAVSLYRSIQDEGALSNALLHIGSTYCENLDRHEEARTYFLRALEISTEIGDRNEKLFDRLYLGRCSLHGNDLQAARAHYSEASSEAEAIDSDEGRWLSLSGLAKVEESSGNVAMAMEHYRSCIDLVEAARHEDVPAEFRAGFFESQQDIHVSAARLILSDAASPDDVSRAFRIVEGSRARSLLDRLGGEPVTLERLRNACLRDDEAFVEILLTEETLIVFVITEHSADALLLDTLAPRIPHLIQRAWIQLQHDRPLFEGAIAEIARELLDPILAKLPSSIRKVVLAPDGALSTIPFAALPLSDSGGSGVLVERYGISYTPSASVFASLRGRKKVTYEYDLVAFANPRLPSTPSASEKASELTPLQLLVQQKGLQSLPESEIEVHRVARRIRGSQRIRSGESANAAEFRDCVTHSTRVFHCASHAVLAPGDPGGSAIVLSPRADGSSGGLIRAEEIEQMSTGIDLVTLSACRTAEGEQVRGEGVVGLSRSFLSAGANSVLGTLWSVDDKLSSEFMAQFYYFLHRGLPKIEALRQAQIAMLSSGTVPHSAWAPYVLVGEGSTSVFRRNFVGPSLAALTVGLVTAGLLFILLRRCRNPGPR